MPVLEDIHLAVEIPNKNTDSEFYRSTINEILVKMNSFLVSKIETYKHLIPTYIDVLSIFISNINEVSLLTYFKPDYRKTLLKQLSANSKLSSSKLGST